jgi:hypothetical protein
MPGEEKTGSILVRAFSYHETELGFSISRIIMRFRLAGRVTQLTGLVNQASTKELTQVKAATERTPASNPSSGHAA